LLSKAHFSDPERPDLLADLAGVHYLLGVGRDQPRDLLRAIEQAQRALEIAPGLAPAAFNVDLALREIGLKSGKPGLIFSGGSPWEEFRERLLADEEVSAEEIASIAGSGFTQQIRELGEHVLLGRWGTAILARDSRSASRRLATVLQLGSALAAINSESTLASAAEQIERAGAGRERALALGYVELASGLESLQRLDFSHAARQLRAAQARLHEVQSPMAPWARHYAASADAYVGAIARAEAVQTDLIESLGTGGTRGSLLGRSLWARGHVRLISGRYVEALEDIRTARSLFEQLGERENMASLDFLLSEVLPELGREIDADRALWRATRAWPWIPSLLRKQNLLLAWLDRCKLEVLPRTSRMILEHLEQNASALDDGLAGFQVAQVKLQLATTPEEAGARYDEARAWLPRIEQRTLRELVAATLDLDFARSTIATRPQVALRAAGEGFSRFRRSGNIGALDGLLLRAQARAKGGDLEGARSDLREALRDLQRRQLQATSRSDRALLHERAAALSTAVVEVLHNSGALPEAVWTALHEVRAVTRGPRHEPEGRWSEVPGPTTLERLQRRLQRGEGVLEFAVTSREVLAWFVRSERMQFAVIAIDRESLSARIRELARLHEEDSRELSRRAAELSRLLLGPFAEISDLDRLTIVPDGPLFELPYYLLSVSGGQGRLGEKMELAFALQSIGKRSSAGGQRQEPEAPVVFVADPAFNRELFESLPRLGWSAQEAGAAADLYPRVARLVGREAKLSAIRMALRERPRILHIGAHTLESSDRPWASGFVLAPESDTGDGIAWAADLAELNFDSVELAVLAGCGTGKAARPSPIVPTTLARSVLEGGAQAVLSTLIDVKDADAAEFLTAVHRSLARGRTPTGAVQDAILGLKSTETPGLEHGILASVQVIRVFAVEEESSLPAAGVASGARQTGNS
jgi:CHAT domain-containing protein